jgi:hypothetical protein
MAQDGVVKEPLTEVMIRAGAELTRKLDERGWPVIASLWLYRSEANRWRLVLASPLVASDGRRKSYEIVQAALEATPAAEGTMALSNVSVTEPTDPLIALLRAAARTETMVEGLRFTRTVINGRFIDDAYIYRMSDTAPSGQVA